MAKIDVPKLVLEAEARTREFLIETPMEYSHSLSKVIEGEVYLKLDLFQKTDSFKFRGAVNKIMSLSDEELDRGVVSASTGNFALAIAEAMRLRGKRATIYVAKNLVPDRLDLLRSRGLDLVIFGEEAGEAEKEADRVAKEEGKLYISPYNDEEVIGGQGTCGFEISKQCPEADVVFVAVGGGGLISGCAGWLKSFNPNIEIIGVSPKNSPVMYQSIKEGKMVELTSYPTLADTCAGGVDADTITFDIIKDNVDDMMVLDEDEIAASIKYLFENHRVVSEGSGALGVGALIRNKGRFKGKKVVLVVCGRNIGLETFKKIIS